MKIGIDLHGVITYDPGLFSELSKEFLKNNHEIHIITGSLLNDALSYKLRKYGMVWTELFSISSHHKGNGGEISYDKKGDPWIDPDIWNKAKGIYCYENNIAFHIDDTLRYKEFFKTPFCYFKNGYFEYVSEGGLEIEFRGCGSEDAYLKILSCLKLKSPISNSLSKNLSIG